MILNELPRTATLGNKVNVDLFVLTQAHVASAQSISTHSLTQCDATFTKISSQTRTVAAQNKLDGLTL
jgi:hypothetical protein